MIIRYKDSTLSTAMFNQLRVFDIKREDYYSGSINKKVFKELEIKLLEFMRISPLEKEGFGQLGRK